MRWQFLIGFPLIITGFILAGQDKRPWIDYVILSMGYGLLFVLDGLIKRLKGLTLFSNIQSFLLIAFMGIPFWWFYEWTNTFLKDWIYPSQKLYAPIEWGILTTAWCTMFFPISIVLTSTISFLILRKNVVWIENKLNKNTAICLIALGAIFFLLAIILPQLFFPLVWPVVFLILDPINSMHKKRSLISQIAARNYLPLIILSLAGVLLGLIAELINYFISTWNYPLVAWFWNLPPPITTKIIQMPLAGYLGYIPFMFSAFAFLEFMGIKASWLESKS